MARGNKFQVSLRILWILLCLLGLAKEKGGAATNKLNIPQITAKESLQQFDLRRVHLLEGTAGRNITSSTVANTAQDPYSRRAVANLALGRFEKEANERMRYTTQWFVHKQPGGGVTWDGECDFAAITLCQGYYLFRGTPKLELPTIEGIQSFFFNNNFQSRHHSENHDLIFRATRFLMAQAFPDAAFAAYGKRGSQLLIEDRDWLRNFIRFRARQGWAEFDCTAYYAADWNSLTALYEFSETADLKQLAGMMLDLILADMAVDSMHGLYGGAHGRTKGGHVVNHTGSATYAMQYLFFGNVDPTSMRADTELGVALSSYRPSEMLVELGIDRPESYINLERKHLHNLNDVMPMTPLPGSIRKYTWYTPDFIMGAVQKQDPYPANHSSAWYAHHQQQEWDLTIGTRVTSRLFTHHPGIDGTHDYWVGDTRCNCGHFFQNLGALIGLYEIDPKQTHKFIHAFVPKNSFDEFREEPGVIFVREGNVCAALRMLPGYKWTTSGQYKDTEIVSLTTGTKHAVVCEVAPLSVVGTFDNFRYEILSNAVEYDEQAMTLTYQSKRYGTLRIDTKGLRELNGQPAQLNYPSFENPYMQSAWDSGIIQITKGNRRMLLDFPAAKRTMSYLDTRATETWTEF